MDNSPFARLPAELRNAIWELALTKKGDVRVIRYPRPGRGPSPAALLQTCKQIRSEARLLFYAHNTFYVPLHVPPDPLRSTLERWHAAIGAEAQAVLGKVEVAQRAPPPPPRRVPRGTCARHRRILRGEVSDLDAES